MRCFQMHLLKYKVYAMIQILQIFAGTRNKYIWYALIWVIDRYWRVKPLPKLIKLRFTDAYLHPKLVNKLVPDWNKILSTLMQLERLACPSARPTVTL